MEAEPLGRWKKKRIFVSDYAFCLLNFKLREIEQCTGSLFISCGPDISETQKDKVKYFSVDFLC